MSATPKPRNQPDLLLVDDSDIFRRRLARALSDRGYEVRMASNYDEAMAAVDEHAPEMAVIDLRMPGPSGLELLRDMRKAAPSVEAVVLTGYGSIATAIDAVRLGAVNYVQKPADADDLLAAFEHAACKPLEAVDHDYDAPSLARAEWEHIQRVLRDCGGNISETARRLGIHRRTLQRKLDKFAP